MTRLSVGLSVSLVVVITMIGFLYSPWNQWNRQLYMGQAGILLRKNQNQTSTNIISLKQEDTFPETCAPNKTFVSCCQPLTALASFPGSGNTWVRYLLEKATGYYTGSVYGDRELIRKGFRGEGRQDRNVLAIKTHRFGHKSKIDYERILLILRSPVHSFLAEFNRKQTKDHMGYATEGKFKKAWANFFTAKAVYWKHFHEYWFSRGVPMYIIDYETLKADLREELKRVLNFLGISVSAEKLDCVIHNSEGSFHRKHEAEQFDPYTDEMKEVLNDLVKEVEKMRNEVLANETRTLIKM